METMKELQESDMETENTSHVTPHDGTKYETGVSKEDRKAIKIEINRLAKEIQEIKEQHTKLENAHYEGIEEEAISDQSIVLKGKMDPKPLEENIATLTAKLRSKKNPVIKNLRETMGALIHLFWR